MASNKRGSRLGPPPGEIVHRELPMGLLAPHEDNYNEHPEDQIGGLVESIAEFGQVRDIVVWERDGGARYVIVAGEGFWTAALRADMETIACRVIPASWPPEKVLGYLVADNLHAQKSKPNLPKLADILTRVANSGVKIESMGMSREGLNALVEDLADKALEAAGDVLDKQQRERTLDLKEPEGGEVEASFGVMVECKDEDEQQDVYELLNERGYNARVLTL